MGYHKQGFDNVLASDKNGEGIGSESIISYRGTKPKILDVAWEFDVDRQEEITEVLIRFKNGKEKWVNSEKVEVIG